MNLSLLDKLEWVEHGVLATVLTTDGHTFQKTGAKALFAMGSTVPVYGSLGSLCADQDILAQAQAAIESRIPRRMSINTADESDIHLGYGAYCGGTMEILLEPVFDSHRAVYRDVRSYVEVACEVVLIHHLDDGRLEVAVHAPEANDAQWVEPITALPKVFLFGATPLSRRIADYVEDMDILLHVIDWRRHQLDGFSSAPFVRVLSNEFPFDADSRVVVLSHSFERDRAALERALRAGCGYIGLLGSKKRREKMFAELREAGIEPAHIETVRSPVGLDLGGRSPAEIAVSIVAELVRFNHQ